MATATVRRRRSAQRSARARGLRTLQHQTLPASTRYAIDTEVWFRSLMADRAGERRRSEDRPTKDQVHDEALAWFLRRHARQNVGQYPARRSADEDTTFWIDSRLLERARRMAARDGVRVARLIDAALGEYVKAHVPARLIEFRQSVQQQAGRLYESLLAQRKRTRRPGG